jgi:outer membrane protein TolC
VTDNIEVVSAQDSLARANDNQIEAMYRFSAARASLARALGRVEETFGRSK